MPNPITDGQPINEGYNAFISNEQSDLKHIIRSVLLSKFEEKLAADKIKLITTPDSLLTGKDGLVLQILQKKAVPVYNLLARFGVVWIVDKVLPTATKEVAPLQFYLNLDKIKLLTTDPEFMASFNDSAKENEIIEKLVAIMVPCAKPMVGGKRSLKQRKYKKSLKSKK